MELEDHSKPLVWTEKARSEVYVSSIHANYHRSFVFEAVNDRRLIVKIAIFHVPGDSKLLHKTRFEPVDLAKCNLIGEQVLRLYDVVNNNCYMTKPL